MYSRESLETLKTKIDLVDLVQSHVELKRNGATYKGLCPFHDEKSPSFIIQRGDSHYHCFGCQAHGDAIAFLMNHLRMSFSDAVVYLAERFDVPLIKNEGEDKSSDILRKDARKALLEAAEFFHFYLLHTDVGHVVLGYLYERGLDLEFIKKFQVGLSPIGSLLTKVLKEKGHKEAALEAAGLFSRGHDFFQDRITFPILDAVGHVIGFSARKYKEETFGGKYVNSSETCLFKKSHVLFGLSYSRARIAKEHRALIVEGQIDALRLIQEGFDFTVASQGTAFTDYQGEVLYKLGIKKVLLAFDSDKAGQEATIKVGDMFIRLGVEVVIVQMPNEMDPDSFLLVRGPKAFGELLVQTESYISFLIRQHPTSTAVAKVQAAHAIKERITAWPDPLMVHESLKELAILLQVPEETLGLKAGQVAMLSYQKKLALKSSFVDPIKVLETDLISLMLLGLENDIVFSNLKEEHFLNEACKRIYKIFLDYYARGQVIDILTVATSLNSEEDLALLNEILQKKVNTQRLKGLLREVIQKILERQWMWEAELLRVKIQSLNHSESEALLLAKELAELRKNPPKVL